MAEAEFDEAAAKFVFSERAPATARSGASSRPLVEKLGEAQFWSEDLDDLSSASFLQLLTCEERADEHEF